EECLRPMVCLFDGAHEIRPSCWHVTAYPDKSERARGVPFRQYSRFYTDDGKQQPTRIWVHEGFWNAEPDDVPPNVSLGFPQEESQAILEDSLAIYFGAEPRLNMSEFLSSLERECVVSGEVDVRKAWLSGLLGSFKGVLFSESDGHTAVLATQPELLQTTLDVILPPAINAILESPWYQSNLSSLVWDDELGQLVVPT
ncbi:MAG: hypothetical protein QOJ65_983, partial [Fimbriimonadaceae bacterium]|nr:hypothetical protein [Fimbriimonadaceae bacterium]